LRNAPKTALPMDVLRTAVSALAFYDADEKNNDHDANVRKAIRLTSQIAMIVAAYDRIRKGKPVVEARPLALARRQFPVAVDRHQALFHGRARARYRLILHADHELNASTFAARVTAATLSDMHSAITSAIGALKGPLHGGANEAVFRILESIDRKKADPVEHVRNLLAQKEENSRLRPSRLSHRRSAGHAPARDVARSGPLQRSAAVV
jgi:citrate synthase